MNETRVLLIGGASHTGKSTLAAALGERLDWQEISTDQLGRHPGRPWPVGGRKVPQNAREHYERLSPEELRDSVLDYQRRMWLTIERIVAHRLVDRSSRPLVIEGSAVLAEKIEEIPMPDVQPFWLTASRDVLRRRIFTSSEHESRSPAEKMLIERFEARNDLLDRHARAHLDGFEDRLIDVSDAPPPEDIAALIVNHIRL